MQYDTCLFEFDQKKVNKSEKYFPTHQTVPWIVFEVDGGIRRLGDGSATEHFKNPYLHYCFWFP